MISNDQEKEYNCCMSNLKVIINILTFLALKFSTTGISSRLHCFVTFADIVQITVDMNNNRPNYILFWHACLYTHLYTHLCVCVRVCVFMCVCVCVCMGVSWCLYMHGCLRVFDYRHANKRMDTPFKYLIKKFMF